MTTKQLKTSPAPWSIDPAWGQIRDFDGWALASYPRNLGGPQDTANARLMAKAPELLAAIQEAILQLETMINEQNLSVQKREKLTELKNYLTQEIERSAQVIDTWHPIKSQEVKP